MPAHGQVPTTEDEFNKWIYQEFRTACRAKRIKASRELFMETLQSDTGFARMIEKLKRDLGIGTNTSAVQQVVDRLWK